MGKQRQALKLAIKDEILGKFHTLGAKPGMVLPPSWLHEEFLPTLSVRENEALEEAIAEMIAGGLIEYQHAPRPTYRLTADGAKILC